jgi:hypothetical protein
MNQDTDNVPRVLSRFKCLSASTRMLCSFEYWSTWNAIRLTRHVGSCPGGRRAGLRGINSNANGLRISPTSRAT